MWASAPIQLSKSPPNVSFPANRAAESAILLYLSTSLCSTIATQHALSASWPQKTIAFLTPCAHRLRNHKQQDRSYLQPLQHMRRSLRASWQTARVSALPLLSMAPRKILDWEICILPTEGSPRPDPELPDAELRAPASLASLGSAQHEEKERHDDRIETIAIAISLLLLISGLGAIFAAVLLSRPLLRASGLLLNPIC